jgi:hypothetical protein
MNEYRMIIPAGVYVTVHAKNKTEALEQARLIKSELDRWDSLAEIDELFECLDHTQEELNLKEIDGRVYTVYDKEVEVESDNGPVKEE